MNYYKNYFNKVLLEYATPSLPSPDMLDGDTDKAVGNALEPETDSQQLLSKGIKDTMDKIQADFDQRMSRFANALSPETVKTMTIDALKEEISKVYKYVDGIQVFAKSKIDQLQQNPSAILAAFIASDPQKQSAFEALHTKLEEFTNAMDEMTNQIGTLKSNIDEFVQDVQEADVQASQMQQSQSPPDQSQPSR